MKNALFLVVFLAGFQQITAQYTEIINSKRPGFSESPYGVGTNVYQFEAGMFYNSNNDKTLGAFAKTLGGELFFRVGKFKERLEINANVAYQRDEVNNYPNPNYHINGISDLTVGAKYLVYQQEYKDKSKEIRSWKRKMAFDKKRLIPSVGVYGGVHLNVLGKDYKDDGMSYKGALLLQNDFTDRLILLTNLIADKISSEDKYYSYIVTMTYTINQNWSYFIENQGKFYNDFSPNYQFGTGVAYLVTENLQLDASARTNFLDDYSYLYATAGFSWRLDRHKDSFVYKNAPKEMMSKKPNKKGFFSRLFKKNRN
ncbi:MAG: transporter [Lutibacter sp.]|nr:transporter [Lutibacter sp.]